MWSRVRQAIDGVVHQVLLEGARVRYQGFANPNSSNRRDISKSLHMQCLYACPGRYLMAETTVFCGTW